MWHPPWILLLSIVWNAKINFTWWLKCNKQFPQQRAKKWSLGVFRFRPENPAPFEVLLQQLEESKAREKQKPRWFLLHPLPLLHSASIRSASFWKIQKSRVSTIKCIRNLRTSVEKICCLPRWIIMFHCGIPRCQEGEGANILWPVVSYTAITTRESFLTVLNWEHLKTRIPLVLNKNFHF